MDEQNTIRELKQQIEALKNAVAALSQGKPVTLRDVTLDTLALGDHCTVEMHNCSVGTVLAGDADDLEDLRVQIDDIGCMLDDLSCQLDDIDAQLDEIEDRMED